MQRFARAIWGILEEIYFDVADLFDDMCEVVGNTIGSIFMR
jgi:hypothetical protein